jgi:hypothetical protein
VRPTGADASGCLSWYDATHMVEYRRAPDAQNREREGDERRHRVDRIDHAHSALLRAACELAEMAEGHPDITGRLSDSITSLRRLTDAALAAQGISSEEWHERRRDNKHT